MGVHGERVLVHNELTKGQLFVFTSDTGKEKVDLCLRLLEKFRGDGNVDFAELTSQRQSIFNFA
uniref:Uncharacterized protein n=1 Tax=Hyaloperonospora arabidopsidis (strain Emoy2) TaxID=559515 RepID=M4B6F8_HYAAE